MEFSKLLAPGIMAALLLALTACEDPSNVGLGLVGDESGTPVVNDLPITAFDAIPDPGIRDNTGQVLVGMVDDPAFGQIQATGYIDFQNNTNPPSGFRNGPVSAVILRLDPSYLYGDTLQEITLGVHGVLSEYLGVGATADSIPEVGPELTRVSFSPTASTVSVELPADWVAANEADLRSTDFAREFHGFMLAPVAGNAVVGFANVVTASSRLRSVVGTDTVNFSAVKSITRFERLTPAADMPSRTVLQNGIGPRLSVNFDVSSINQVDINRVNMRFSADTLAIADTPNFTRPATTDISLYGIASDSTSELLDIGTVDDEGFLDFNSEALRSHLVDIALGGPPFIGYELRFPLTTGNTVNTLVLYDTTATTAAPSVTLTVTPLN